MNKEQIFPITEDQIFAAERERAMGNVSVAIEAMHPVVEYPLGRFHEMSEDEKKRLLMASRIYVVGNGSLAKRAWEAPTVAHYLGQSREALINIYGNPNVQQATLELKEDTRGNPYEFSTEMVGDEVSYTLTLAALIRNPGLLNTAIERMDAIIENSQEPTAKTLAQFNRARILYHMNRNSESFSALRQTFDEAVNASQAINRWERVSTIAARYAIDSVRNLSPIEAIRGVTTSTKALVSDRSILTILPREAIKELAESARHTNWLRTTAPGTDYSYLTLP